LAKAKEQALAVLRAERDAADHRTLHGSDSIVSDQRDYHIRVGGQRYVHVGEHNGQWVYRPD